VTIVSANGQNDQVTIDFASGGSFALPGGLSIQGNSAPGSNTLVLRGTNGGDTFTVNGGTITADGLSTTSTNADVQQITIVGGSGNDKYQLPASRANVSITDAGAVNSLGFSGISGTSGMTLSLASRSAQAIAAWGSASWGNKTLTLGGSLGAAGSTTIVHCGNVNSTITGGSGNNILVGGGGQNILTGGPARNLLIGGSGKSTLRGKGQDNILVSGTTNDDTNDQALLSILNEGSRQAMLNNIMLAALATRLHSPAILNQGLVTTSSGAGNSLTCGPGKNLCFLGSQDTYHAK
jgi:Ca2+-binding RTX toxin-like protein